MSQSALEPLPATEAAGAPVFASESGRRARVVRLGAAALAALTAIWVVALLAGALGMGHLPALPLPDVGNGGSPEADGAAAHSGSRPSGRSARARAGAHRPARGSAAKRSGANVRHGSRGRPQTPGLTGRSAPGTVPAPTTAPQVGAPTSPSSPAVTTAPTSTPVVHQPTTGKPTTAPAPTTQGRSVTAPGKTVSADPPSAAPLHRSSRYEAGT